MGDALTFSVPAELDGARLDKALAELAGVSRSVARELVDSGAAVDGVGARPTTRVKEGETITAPRPPEAGLLEAEPVEFAVLYEDDSLVVVDKPAGLVVHPGSGNLTGTLASGLLHRYPQVEGVGREGRWGIVHRLDKDTSGALLVALTDSTHEGLVAQLQRREIGREYLSLVDGLLKPPTGTIDAPIGRDPHMPTRRSVVRDGKPARTHYRLVENFESAGVALAAVTLETGRTHQIRVHFAAIGHPVIGDRTYGMVQDVDSPRIFLHAAKLSFTHPLTGEAITVEAPLPTDLSRVLEGLGLIRGGDA